MSGDVTYDIFFGIIILVKHEEEVHFLVPVSKRNCKSIRSSEILTKNCHGWMGAKGTGSAFPFPSTYEELRTTISHQRLSISRLIKPGFKEELKKIFKKRLFSSTGLFMDWKLQIEIGNTNQDRHALIKWC